MVFMQTDVKTKFLRWFENHHKKSTLFMTIISKTIENLLKKCQITDVETWF